MPDFWIQNNRPALFLAPMEGVTDWYFRTLITKYQPFTHTVSEFFRISNSVPGVRAYQEHVPELKQNSLTPTGTPVIFQLLGGSPERLSEAAFQATLAGAKAIDINFGCPAPTVNRHDGGASLLKCPERIFQITQTVREKVPPHIPVSVKLRLGWDDPEAIYENAQLAWKAGASWITVHGRTRMQGYTPPAYWRPIGRLRQSLPIPIVANGEIWTLEDFKQCREETNCEHFMIGRGTLANPYLCEQIAKELGITQTNTLEFPGLDFWLQLMNDFIAISLIQSSLPKHILGRIKQWFGYVNMKNKIENIKSIQQADSIEDFLKALNNLQFCQKNLR